MLLDGVEGDHELARRWPGSTCPPPASPAPPARGWSAARPGPAPPRGPGRAGGPAQCARRQRRAGAGPGSRAGPRRRPGRTAGPRSAGPAARPSAVPRRRRPGHSPAGRPAEHVGQGVPPRPASSPLAASASARSAPASIRLPIRSWATAARVQPVQQRERLGGPLLGQQHPGQHQVSRLPRVVRLVVRVEAALFRPARGRGQVALGQQQPRPLRRDRVEQAGRVPAQTCMASPIASRAPAGSPAACRIHASVTRPAASGVV